MNEHLWLLLEQLGAVVVFPILGVLATILIQRIKLQSMKIKGDKWEQIKLIVNIAIQSSEQQYKAGVVKDRKEHAMEVSKRLLKERKLVIEDSLLSELIESQVMVEINSGKG